MNIAILTSNQPRHNAFISTITNILKPVLVVCEAKNPLSFVDLEEKFFVERCNNLPQSFPEKLNVEKGEINSNVVKEKLVDKKVDVLFVFGTSILKPEVFEIPNFCVNIHTGLVQSYRGVDSNFWAVYEDNIESIGVTVHKINAGIDTGGILLQSRIPLSTDDSSETIFLKSCEVGFSLIENNFDLIVNEQIQEIKMKKRGKLFKISNMNDLAKKKVDETIKNRIKAYLENCDNRNKRVKLINGVK